MGRLFFIAGCARSGTTLLLELMPSFKDMHALMGAEKHFSYFSKMDATDGNVLLKRDFNSYLTLPVMAPHINLIYAIRHPFDALTSYHPAFPHRKFYVSEKRWRGEYAALKELRVETARTDDHLCALLRPSDVAGRCAEISLDQSRS